MDIDKKLLDYQENKQIEIKIELSTIERDGLILWQGRADDSTVEYISLAIMNGMVSIFTSKQWFKFQDQK